jgi:hypothetical protein
VVKVKGITGIAAQNYVPNNTDYAETLIYAELNSEVTSIAANGFRYAIGLKAIVSDNITVGNYSFGMCGNLENNNTKIQMTAFPISVFTTCLRLREFEFAEGTATIGTGVCSYCALLKKAVIPSTVTEIGQTVFYNCASLKEIHIKATIPPILGANTFNGLPSSYIIYVPVGYGDTYKSAAGWSTYADHILEEGQTPNRMMLAKFDTYEPQDDMR